jgi:hypothetical protein
LTFWRRERFGSETEANLKDFTGSGEGTYIQGEDLFLAADMEVTKGLD